MNGTALLGLPTTKALSTIGAGGPPLEQNLSREEEEAIEITCEGWVMCSETSACGTLRESCQNILCDLTNHGLVAFIAGDMFATRRQHA
jgi:hypothetical protein